MWCDAEREINTAEKKFRRWRLANFQLLFYVSNIELSKVLQFLQNLWTFGLLIEHCVPSLSVHPPHLSLLVLYWQSLPINQVPVYKMKLKERLKLHGTKFIALLSSHQKVVRVYKEKSRCQVLFLLSIAANCESLSHSNVCMCDCMVGPE